MVVLMFDISSIETSRLRICQISQTLNLSYRLTHWSGPVCSQINAFGNIKTLHLEGVDYQLGIYYSRRICTENEDRHQTGLGHIPRLLFIR